METVQMIQQISPAAAIVAALALPWVAAVVMHAVSAMSNVSLNEQRAYLANAATRWTGLAISPASQKRNVVLQFTAPVAATPEYLKLAA
jgi:hypothetical protein